MDMSWRKSSYSTSNGGQCIEVGVWRKSSYSTSNGGSCVEVATTLLGDSAVGAATCTCGKVGRAADTAPWRTLAHRGNSGAGRVAVAAGVTAAPWLVSNHGGEFVTVGGPVTDAPWRTSTHSSTNGGECVQTATLDTAVAVRDTKDNGTGPVLRFTPVAWRSFTSTLK
jgi:hypothetical protein